MQELKKRAALLKADAVIGMRQDVERNSGQVQKIVPKCVDPGEGHPQEYCRLPATPRLRGSAQPRGATVRHHDEASSRPPSAIRRCNRTPCRQQRGRSFQAGLGGVGLHHQGPVCWSAAAGPDGEFGRGRTCPPHSTTQSDPAQRRVNGSSPRRHGRRSQARRQLLPRCRWRSARPGSRTSTPTSATSRAAHAASPPQ